MNQLAPIVDHAAQQSDRWMFIAMLVIVLGFGLLVIRYLVRRDETERQRMHESYEKNVEVNRQLAVTLNANTSALNRSTDLHEQNVDALRAASDELRRCREVAN